MKLKALILTIIVLFVISADGQCDHATPLSIHLKKAKTSFKNKDYNTTITQSCNALYHGRQKSISYSLLGRSYEALDDPISAIASYLRYIECCKADNIRVARRRIEYLKDLIDKEELKNIIDKIPRKVLSSKALYKKNRMFRVRDYIYNPQGQLIEEKYCRADKSYEYKIEYIYDRKGNLVEKMKFDEHGKLLETESISYSDGKKMQETKRAPAGQVLGEKTYNYDFAGNVKSILTHNRDNDLIFKETFSYNGDDIYEETSKNYKDPSAFDNFTARYTYKAGKLAMKEVNFSRGLFEKVKYFYKYDRLSKEVFYSAEDIPVRSKKYNYNNNGDLREVGEYKIWKRRKDVLQTKVSYQYSKIFDQ